MKRIRRRSDLPRHRTRDSREQRRLQEGLAELEFRADLEPNMDPISAAGYEPGKGRSNQQNLVDNQGELAGLYQPPSGRNDEGDSLPFFDKMQMQTDQNVRFGDVVVSRDYLDSEVVWAHEFRHRGMNRIRTSMDRETFSEKYGEETAAFLYDSDREEDFVRSLDQKDDRLHYRVPDDMREQSPRLAQILNQAAFDTMEDDTSESEDRKSAVSWLKSFFNRGEE